MRNGIENPAGIHTQHGNEIRRLIAIDAHFPEDIGAKEADGEQCNVEKRIILQFLQIQRIGEWEGG